MKLIFNFGTITLIAMAITQEKATIVPATKIYYRMRAIQHGINGKLLSSEGGFIGKVTDIVEDLKKL